MSSSSAALLSKEVEGLNVDKPEFFQASFSPLQKLRL